MPRWFHDAVVNPQQKNRKKADGGYHPPNALRLVRDFAKLVHDAAAEPSPTSEPMPMGRNAKPM